MIEKIKKIEKGTDDCNSHNKHRQANTHANARKHTRKHTQTHAHAHTPRVTMAPKTKTTPKQLLQAFLERHNVDFKKSKDTVDDLIDALIAKFGDDVAQIDGYDTLDEKHKNLIDAKLEASASKEENLGASVAKLADKAKAKDGKENTAALKKAIFDPLEKVYKDNLRAKANKEAVTPMSLPPAYLNKTGTNKRKLGVADSIPMHVISAILNPDIVGDEWTQYLTTRMINDTKKLLKERADAQKAVMDEMSEAFEKAAIA